MSAMKKTLLVLLPVWLIILFIPVYFYFSPEKFEKEEVCIKMYLLAGHVRTKCYDLPKGSEVYNKGTLLVYKCPAFLCGEHVIKRSCVDFEIVKCK